MDYFLREKEFALYYGAESWTIEIELCHKDAHVERVFGRTEPRRDKYGPLPSVTVGVIFIRDHGEPLPPKWKKKVVVVRRTGGETRLPPQAGAFLGAFPSDGGRHQWLVFLSREPARSSLPYIDSTPAKASSPPPPSAAEAPPHFSSSTAPPETPPPSREDPLFSLGESPQTVPPRPPEISPR